MAMVSLKAFVICLLGCILQWKCPKNLSVSIYFQHRYSKFILYVGLIEILLKNAGVQWNGIENLAK